MRPYVLIGRKLRGDPPNLHDLAWARPRSFSQFGEDRFLERHFADKPTGFYVDVGAYHPYDASNTYLLYKRGWRGMNIEPDPEAFRQFQQHRPADINLPIAVSRSSGTAPFVRAGTFAGIANDTHLWPGIEGERITVVTRTLSEVLAENLPAGTSIDLLDVDCEGHDLEILRSNDWQRFRPEVVMAEAHDESARVEIERFLGSVDYRPLTRVDLTMFFIAT